MGKVTFTICTPIPMFIPREIAVEALHDHGMVINTNPLVLDYVQIPPPKVAASEELGSAWYEINERIQYVPGIGKMGSGKISFPGCFHDMPWGLQTHIHAPLGVDLRVQYRVAGEVIGVETFEPRELGLADAGAPEQGLYLRTDAEVKCNGMLSSFVKSQTKDAQKAMVAQIVKNAERMDSDLLARMISQERLARNATLRDTRRGQTGGVPFGAQPSIPEYPPLPGQSQYGGQPQYGVQPQYGGPAGYAGQLSGHVELSGDSVYSGPVELSGETAFVGQTEYIGPSATYENKKQSWI